jgi:hypothetical protein
MRQAFIIIVFLFSLSHKLFSQSFTDSNLPIVIITTDFLEEIKDDPRVSGIMKIIYRGPGQRNYLIDQDNEAVLNYNGRINIELRGSSSQAMPKKQYGFSTLMADNYTINNIKLLGMPAEHDWILNGMIFDPALMRDYLCYNLSRQIGEYASRTAYCELVINGVFKGLYLLQEKIKADENRVNIVKIDNTDNAFPDISGGYITKADKTTGGDPVAWTMFSSTAVPVSYIHDLPTPQSVTTAQNIYIKKQFEALEYTASSGDTSVVNGYPSVIDVRSFIDHMLISELSSNADSYMYSTFFHKDRNGKLRAGPIWDNDLTFGNDLFLWGLNRSHTDIWQFSNGDNEGSRFWRDLFNNPWFKCNLLKRWNLLTAPGQPLNIVSLDTLIDQTARNIREAAVRDNARWANTGDFTSRTEAIKSWLNTRTHWIGLNLGQYYDCDITTPPLVISKIMYHPATSAEFPDPDQLEFIEISNNSGYSANMSGIFFGGTGLVYQFPPYSVMKPGSSLILAGNKAEFYAKYGVVPFGQFSRNLSNKGQKLLLSDAFGNTIDYVHYSDTIPWPEADGNGKYIKLNSLDLDNNIASNWSASEDILVSDAGINENIDIQLYPNPVVDILTIKADEEIKFISVIDMKGNMLVNLNVNCDFYQINMSGFSKGTYIIRVTSALKTSSAKIVKD